MCDFGSSENNKNLVPENRQRPSTWQAPRERRPMESRRATFGGGGLTISQPSVGVGGAGADAGGEVWDDGAILKAFDDALSSHNRKPSSQNKEPAKYTLAAAQNATTNHNLGRRSIEGPGRQGAGIPGPWEPVVAPRESERDGAHPRGYAPHDAGHRHGHPPPPGGHYDYGAHHHSYGVPRSAPGAGGGGRPNGGGEAAWERHGLPPPPAPPHPGSGIHGAAFQSLDGVHDDELADLLLAWYYSGYYTGRFRAMQELRSGRSRGPHPPHPPAGPGAPNVPNHSALGGVAPVPPGSSEGWGERQQAGAGGWQNGYHSPVPPGSGGSVGHSSPGRHSDRPGMPVPSSAARSRAS